MSDNADVLDYDFILELFKGCLTSKDFLEVVCANCKETYIPEGALTLIFKEIKSFYVVEGRRPTIGTLRLKLRKNRQALETLEEVKQIDEVDIDTLLKAFEGFIKSCKFMESFNKIADTYSIGDKTKAYKMFENAAAEIEAFTLEDQMFERVFSDFSKRQTERLSPTNETFKVPTGIDQLDRILNGGAESGEFWLYMAASKGAKSFLLNHLGIVAARLGYGVFHVQAEGTKRQVFTRYDSAWSGTLYHEMKQGIMDDKKYNSYKKILDNLGKTDIHVFTKEKFGSITMIDIRRKLIKLKKKCDIKVVIIDYLDLINPTDEHFSSLDERFRQQRTAEMMKDLAVEFNIVVISVTQASNFSPELKNNPDFVITRDLLAENKAKVQKVDVLISANRTDDEEDEGTCRLWIDAAREHKRTGVIRIKQNLARSRFYDRKKTLATFFNEIDEE